VDLFLRKRELSDTMITTTTPPRKRTERPTEVDRQIGIRVRQRRTATGLSAEALASKIDCTKNFLGKLERGDHIFSAARVLHLAQLLDVPVSFLYGQYSDGREDLPGQALQVLDNFLCISPAMQSAVSNLIAEIVRHQTAAE
jgi:transcriptional regulator with XRE-family HTH domain